MFGHYWPLSYMLANKQLQYTIDQYLKKQMQSGDEIWSVYRI